MSKTVREYYGIGSHITSKEFVAGVELEIEDVQGNPAQLWSAVPDGSLRNNGCEFVSPPLHLPELIDGFKKIHATIIHHPVKPTPFSERTSIHAHINCLDLDSDQVKSIVMWYALFEPVFFAMVDPIRKNNIHCVPLDQTHLSSKYKKPLFTLVDSWSKYTALNLIPLSTQGTIEFRHMEGHNNVERFESWLKTLENLWKFGQSTPFVRGNIASEAQILNSFDTIFKDAPIKYIRSSVLALCADSLIDVKLGLM